MATSSDHLSLTQQSNERRDSFWRYWFLVPIYPYRKRRTLRREVVANTIWTFEQLQGILYTVVPVRMTIVRLESGGLLVYSPIAPTRECIRLVRELEAEHGAVRYILLTTSSGLEHKVFVPPFARQFPQAQVYVTPHQWSFPFNLPLNWLGFPRDRTQVLPAESHLAPFGDEFEYELLHVDLGRGCFEEMACFHRASKTLLVTDTVLSVPEEPPAIAQADPYPLLFHARDRASDPFVDTEANRRKGWQRIALFALYFQPDTLKTISLGQTIRDAIQASDRSLKGYLGLFPFAWQEDWKRSFDALRGNGRPFVAPILQTLILDQSPQIVLDWAERVSRWQFERIIPCHFDAPFAATPEQFRQAFSVLKPSQLIRFGSESHALPAADVQFIIKLEETLDKLGVTNPPST
ncbi:DUF4336 domain-containing protein [Leptolyngbya ohadii]|uniref:DUF4336 domain-containing protein n=1 Tax=Leptolyngbya ohadii TaxID=1962290 RepID=UPI000B5A0E7F|nr:DUF4336 domain-containing protein [Leptolyngbya ohadii]